MKPQVLADTLKRLEGEIQSLADLAKEAGYPTPIVARIDISALGLREAHERLERGRREGLGT